MIFADICACARVSVRQNPALFVLGDYGVETRNCRVIKHDVAGVTPADGGLPIGYVVFVTRHLVNETGGRYLGCLALQQAFYAVSNNNKAQGGYKVSENCHYLVHSLTLPYVVTLSRLYNLHKKMSIIFLTGAC